MGNAMPYFSGVLILGPKMHLVTQHIWQTYRILENVDAHSGYDFPWSPFRLVPFSAPASYHNFHHSHNQGNYSSFFALWDTVFGTNHAYYKFKEKLKKKSWLLTIFLILKISSVLKYSSTYNLRIITRLNEFLRSETRALSYRDPPSTVAVPPPSPKNVCSSPSTHSITKI